MRDDRQQTLPVLVIDKNLFVPITTGGAVIDGAGQFDTQWPSHGGRLRPEGGKRQGLTPFPGADPFPWCVIDKDVFAPITMGGDVIDGAGDFNAQ